jgi:rare lipoprotein A
MRFSLIYTGIFFWGVVSLLSQNDEFIFQSESYLEYMNDSLGKPIIYEDINDCPGLLYHEYGTASFYARKFHGRKTANGELFDKRKMTIAHKTLPFGSIVQVRKIGSDTALLVRVNDRGPFINGRIIDLSPHAADKLGIEGLADVDILTLTPQSDSLPVNIDYFFAFSYMHNPMCIDFEAFTVLESSTDFDAALEILDGYISEFGERDYYLCIPATGYDRRKTREDVFTYHICKINREPEPIIFNY